MEREKSQLLLGSQDEYRAKLLQKQKNGAGKKMQRHHPVTTMRPLHRVQPNHQGLGRRPGKVPHSPPRVPLSLTSWPGNSSTPAHATPFRTVLGLPCYGTVCPATWEMETSPRHFHPGELGSTLGSSQGRDSSLPGVKDASASPQLSSPWCSFSSLLLLTAGRAWNQEPCCCAVARGAGRQIGAMQGKGSACQSV